MVVWVKNELFLRQVMMRLNVERQPKWGWASLLKNTNYLFRRIRSSAYSPFLCFFWYNFQQETFAAEQVFKSVGVNSDMQTHLVMYSLT